ncbi:ABC transporter substrate-binding protein [Streptomyces axinellae]|uniref:ABC transporter substrate-binding protein n=1 Tax=Streptomyces axinellae TaxID=552788 RepID=A0ABP6CBU4_9ACTN
MTSQTEWQFRDDRGHRATAGRPPRRVVAYLQAAVSLWEHGLTPVGVFGSAHDGEIPDPAKAGTLPLESVPYLGAGQGLSAGQLLAARPDLLVAVTYDGKGLYGLDPQRTEELQERVPVVALGVGPGHSLSAVRERFARLAAALGAGDGAPGAPELDAASRRLTAAASAAQGIRVLALSPAGADSVHLARPEAWGDLAALAEHGVTMVRPPAGLSANWSTTDWRAAAALEPHLVLSDARGNAQPVERLRGVEGWEALSARATILPWNPELPCGPLAHARFLDGVAAALERAAKP